MDFLFVIIKSFGFAKGNWWFQAYSYAEVCPTYLKVLQLSLVWFVFQIELLFQILHDLINCCY